ncbi:glycoside hydrolase N-terminal domain-containing protein [Jeotgalibaca caeni]|uniref:glycoside hydrolase N-terminal domain-containing protein n=1 Tax=Jeotgalibaca caeni TaxID=3028623 RepID=UPI00237EC71C|nr:glycoside hydrolase N-terminal domain-containing protein [Jeotgalibaca caeni]MDE1550076.1 glycoside hydrolase N-terminal domain-containing protein [Jeotgalibaca caeni]
MRDFYFPEWGVWSNQHAKRWEEAFVVGNGNVGAMLFGEPLQQHLILNAPDFFLKGNPMDTAPDLAPFLPEFRKRIQDDGYETAIIYFEEKATELGYPGLTMSDPIHPLLQIDWMYNDTMIKGDSYRRMTDFKKGVIINTFDDEKDQTFLSKTFINNQNES